MRGDSLFQICFEHAVKLQPLPRGDTERGIADFVAEI